MGNIESRKNIQKVLISPPVVSAYLAIGAVVIGIIVGIFVLVPMMKNTCHPWFSLGCQEVLYRIGPSGSVLVSDPLTGFMYWYDGQYIYSYVTNLPGSCPDKLVDSTGKLMSEATVNNPCLTWRFNESTQKNECVLPPNWSPDSSSLATSYTPQSFQGSQVASGNVFQPVFALDATTMQLIPEKTICALNLPFVQSRFKNSKEYRLSYRLSSGSQALDIYQLFALLREHKVLTTPTGTP